MLEVYCDGGCKVGTGIGAATYLFVRDGVIQYIHSTPIKKVGLTNNRAEYLAIYLALADAPDDCVCNIFSDSEIVIKQINGEYKVKDETLKHLHSAIDLARGSNVFKNVPRTNKYIMICDKMNKQMMEMI